MGQMLRNIEAAMALVVHRRVDKYVHAFLSWRNSGHREAPEAASDRV
jgi:hypothetical protein